MNTNVFWVIVVVIGAFVSYLFCGQWYQKRALLREWKAVRIKAEEKGLTLCLVSDKKYYRRKRPLPRGGILYQIGDNLCVRYEHTTKQEALKFLESWPD